MNPPSEAHTMLKLVMASVGIVMVIFKNDQDFEMMVDIGFSDLGTQLDT